MSRDRAMTRNAGDPRQVRDAERLERMHRERFDNALKAVMATPDGRIVMSALIRRAGVFKSIWHPSSEIHYNAGRQDYGHELMADLVASDEEAYLTMEREELAYRRQQERSIDATHTARADRSRGDDHGE